MKEAVQSDAAALRERPVEKREGGDVIVNDRLAGVERVRVIVHEYL